MYRQPALYDAIYSFKDYAREAEVIDSLIEKHKKSSGNALLDIACGTGKHIEHLKKKYICRGLDLSGPLLRAAKARNPECKFTQGDMMYFDLGSWFDVVVCLFSAIGYVKTFENLEMAFARFGHHLAPGGVMIIEPWLSPEAFRDSHFSMDTVDEPNQKISRMSYTKKLGNVSIIQFSFMRATCEGIKSWTEKSELGLFTQAEYQVALERTGLEVHFEPVGLSGRGLYIGRKAL